MKKYSKAEMRHMLGLTDKKNRKTFSWYDKPVVRTGIIATMKPEERLNFIKQALDFAANEGIDNPLDLLNNTSEDLFAKVFAATFQGEVENIGIANEDGIKQMLLKIANYVIENEKIKIKDEYPDDHISTGSFALNQGIPCKCRKCRK